MKWALILISLLFNPINRNADADEIQSLIRQPRLMAMGGAGVALADDEYALFNNPAGLAGSDKRRFKVLGLGLEASLGTYQAFGDSVSAFSNFKASALNTLMGKDIYMRASGATLIMLPHFELAYIADVQGALNEYNLANPNFRLGYMTTQGIQAGMGWSLKSGRNPIDEWRIGIAAKILWRKGGYFNVSTAGFLEASDQGKSYVNNLVGQYGVGYGADVGTQYVYHADKKTEYLFGASVTDIGDTRFSQSTAMTIPMNVSLGVAAKKNLDFFKIAFDADLRNLNMDTAFVNKTHVGIDFGIPLFDIYAGLNQLRATYGISFDLWITKISLMSYGEELGVSYDQNPSRRYMLQIDFQLPI